MSLERFQVSTKRLSNLRHLKYLIDLSLVEGQDDVVKDIYNSFSLSWPFSFVVLDLV